MLIWEDKQVKKYLNTQTLVNRAWDGSGAFEEKTCELGLED